MASLPPGWEPDYDGSRWLYRYTPTGITQFTFPKPGDEFPEFVAPGAGPISLAPEERLASEKQIKLRKQGLLNVEKASSEFDEDSRKYDGVFRMSATGYFDPSEFMYYEGGLDDAELDSFTEDKDDQPRYPLGFVAELPSNDTILCAEELAPVELDAGPYENNTTTSGDEKLNGSSIAISKSVPTSSLDTIHSAVNHMQIQPSPGHTSHTSVLGDVQHKDVNSLAAPLNTRETNLTKPQFIDPFPRTVSRLPAEKNTPADVSKSLEAIGAAPLVSPSFAYHPAQRTLTPGRSIDDIQAMPSSLQVHQPLSNRTRSKSATHEPWRPSIKFVQTGVMQESQVSTPALSGILALQQKEKDLVYSVEDTRMSAWLLEQALGRSLSRPYNADSPDQISLGKEQPEAFSTAQQQEHDDECELPKPKTSDADIEPVTRCSLTPPRFSARVILQGELTEQRDRVVETIIDVPAMGPVVTSRGVQLVDVSPGLPGSNITRRGAMRKKRFSWESEAEDASDEVTTQFTAPEDSTPSIPIECVHRKESISVQETGDDFTECPRHQRVTNRIEEGVQSAAFAGRHQERVIVHPSPSTSPTPSPRLPFGKFPPTQGQITANKVVVVEATEERKASIATFEVGLHKPLPPLPLSPKGQLAIGKPFAQPQSNAFEQMSELIAVANAVMPSARPQSALQQGPSAESVWRSLRTQASRSALKPDLTTTPFSTPSTKTLDLPSRTTGHARSISQLTESKMELKSPERHHIRSQSLNFSSKSSPTRLHLFSNDDRLSQAAPDGSNTGSGSQAIPAPTDGHKSHKRLSIHKTPVGIFAYHPLRSSPVFAPTADVQGTPEPQSIDYNKEKATDASLLQPEPSDNGTSSSSRSQRHHLQVQVPFVGLPSSPRPSPKFSPRLKLEKVAKLDADEPVQKPDTYESPRAEETFLITQRRPSTNSQVSSPTSSIFSTMRDSSVSATSSMADLDSTPLSDLVGDMGKSQAHRVQHSRLMRRDQEDSSKWTQVEAAQVDTAPSVLSTPPTMLAQAKVLPTTQLSGASIQRPPNVPEAIRPAGTRASQWGSPKIDIDRTGVPFIPTVIVRAPTMKSRSLEKPKTSDKEPPILLEPKLSLASSDTAEHDERPVQPVVDMMQSNNDVGQQTAPLESPRGFIHSLRKSWQFTTSNAPRLGLFLGQGHTRSRSQSTLTESHGNLGDAITMAKKQAVMSWQWTDRDDRLNRDSLPVDTGSISNVKATIRFLNSSLQARRPRLENIDQPGPEPMRLGLEDDTETSTIVVRKVGPPVVVRCPPSPGKQY